WGGWHVFRYADVARVLSEHATFSSDGHRMAQFEGFEDEGDPIGSSRALSATLALCQHACPARAPLLAQLKRMHHCGLDAQHILDGSWAQVGRYGYIL